MPPKKCDHCLKPLHEKGLYTTMVAGLAGRFCPVCYDRWFTLRDKVLAQEFKEYTKEANG